MRLKSLLLLYLVLSLAVSFSFAWGITSDKPYITMNPGETREFSIRLQNAGNEDKYITYTVLDEYGVVKGADVKPPIFLPANTTTHPIEIKFTLHLPRNASLPYYNVTFLFSEKAQNGQGVSLGIQLTRKVVIRNSFVEEPIIKDYSKLIFAGELVLLSVVIVCVGIYVRKIVERKTEEAKKRKKKLEHLKKSVVKLVFLMLLLSFAASLTLADETEATLNLTENNATLTINSPIEINVQEDADFIAKYYVGNMSIPDATCTLRIGNDVYSMDYVSSRQHYERMVRFYVPGEYTFNVSCKAPGYEYKSELGTVYVRAASKSTSKGFLFQRENLPNFVKGNFSDVQVFIYLKKGVSNPNITFERCENQTLEGYLLYTCFYIDVNFDKELINKTVIMFNISHRWIQDNDINVSTITFIKDGERIDVELVEENGFGLVYKYESDSLSLFSVFAKKNIYPTIDYWTMLKIVMDYYDGKVPFSKVEDALKTYYGNFSGKGVASTYPFKEPLNQDIAILLLVFILFILLSFRGVKR